MTRAFLDCELDTIATWWRIWRKDGVALGFSTHDRDLRFGGMLHRAAPGLTPAAIRLTSGFADEVTDIRGALAHDCIAEADLEAGRYDGAVVAIGAVDWETLADVTLYRGTIARVERDGSSFLAELVSAKAAARGSAMSAAAYLRRASGGVPPLSRLMARG